LEEKFVERKEGKGNENRSYLYEEKEEVCN